MKTILLIFCLVMIGAVFAGDTAKYEKKCDPFLMKPGEYACVFPAGPSEEGHVWIDPSSFSFTDRCGFDRGGFGFLVQRTSSGWKIWLGKIKMWANGRDAELKSYGWIRMTDVIQ
jgi:hypothetical protein